MTLEIALVLLILLGAVILFVSGRLRVDLIALLVLVAVAVTGILVPAEVLSGFSNPAVITVWAMFIVSGGLNLTGVTEWVGRQMVRTAGDREPKLVATIMLATGFMSTVILSNVAVAAMMLPVVVDVARRTGNPPSRLLMPMALGSLLGGMTTMIGTPPNILVADAVRDLGLPPFGLFAITPIGVVSLLAAAVFVTALGRHWLPRRDPFEGAAQSGRTPVVDLGDQLLILAVPPGSPMVGSTLASARLGSALGLTVVALDRDDKLIAAPPRDTVLRPGDRLLTLGRPELVTEARQLALAVDEITTAPRLELDLVEARVREDSPLLGATLLQSKPRDRFGLSVLGVRRADAAHSGDLSQWRVLAGDILLLSTSTGVPDEAGLEELGPFPIADEDSVYGLAEDLVCISVDGDSPIAGRTLAESRVRDRFGLAVLGIHRGGRTIPAPDPEVVVEPDDVLVAYAKREDRGVLEALRRISVEAQPIQDLEALTSREVGVVEFVLSPQTTVEGKTPRELGFRARYGLTVLAVRRRGHTLRDDLRDLELRFGDAILAHGPRERLRLLTGDPDFLTVSEPPPPPRRDKAPLAVGILAVVMTTVVVGWLPISIAAVGGASLMVMTRCLTMEDAYRSIEWQAVILIAGMLPLGLAMERTGAAAFLAEGVVSLVEPMGPLAGLAGVYLMTALATQVIPTAALVVLMAPIAYTSAIDLGVSPLPFLMTLAVAASASFSSPISHPANTLVMGPGGYRFVDYMKVGMPLTLVVFAITMVMVPILWPF